LLVAVSLIGPAYTQGDDAPVQGVVIVNANVPVQDISVSTLRRIYLGNMRLWDNGMRIRPAYLPETNVVGERFFESILRMSARSFQKFWVKKTFSGSGTPPSSLNTPGDIIEHVAKFEGAIGIVPRAMAETASGVKMVTVDGELVRF